MLLRFSITLLASAVLPQSAAALQTRSYVVSWFTQAVHSQDGDCPGGENPDIDEQYRRNLAALGKNRAQIDALIKAWQEESEGSDELVDLMNNRGRIDGRPVNAYAHPEAVTDPRLKAMPGRYGYGFDLDKAVSPEDFQDPQSGELGIDHQLFRALGCIRQFRGTATNPPTYGTWLWTMMRSSMPAWLMTLSGENLDADGDITITFDRAMEYAKVNVNGVARAHMTFRASPDSRSHASFKGRIAGRTIQITQHGPLRLLQDPLSFPQLELTQTHLRLETAGPDGSLEGVLGGYQPWHAIYFALGQGGFAAETELTGDLPGIYYLLKRLADADPDPQTGQNRSISVAYRITAVPAFVVRSDAEGRGQRSARIGAQPAELEFESTGAVR